MQGKGQYTIRADNSIPYLLYHHLTDLYQIEIDDRGAVALVTLKFCLRPNDTVLAFIMDPYAR